MNVASSGIAFACASFAVTFTALSSYVYTDFLPSLYWKYTVESSLSVISDPSASVTVYLYPSFLLFLRVMDVMTDFFPSISTYDFSYVYSMTFLLLSFSIWIFSGRALPSPADRVRASPSNSGSTTSV